MNDQIKAGDVVQLKSGSKPMTIVKTYNNDEYADVTWFNDLTNTLDGMKGLTVAALKKVSN